MVEFAIYTLRSRFWIYIFSLILEREDLFFYDSLRVEELIFPYFPVGQLTTPMVPSWSGFEYQAEVGVGPSLWAYLVILGLIRANQVVLNQSPIVFNSPV